MIGSICPEQASDLYVDPLTGTISCGSRGTCSLWFRAVGWVKQNCIQVSGTIHNKAFLAECTVAAVGALSVFKIKTPKPQTPKPLNHKKNKNKGLLELEIDDRRAAEVWNVE